MPVLISCDGWRGCGAGLVPGAVGLYQVNFKVPEGLASGTAKLVVSQAGAESNSVSLPVGK
ncbi:MAG: hypothetical protein EBY17_28390 [Acidobacteriia bacterium]|nr:hypothetical protein [Terriglobia bacterium]